MFGLFQATAAGSGALICMTNSEQLRARARECEAMAEGVVDPELRWLYRDMAAQYRQMARQRDELGLHGRAVGRRDDAA